jgi:hypothetical protein
MQLALLEMMLISRDENQLAQALEPAREARLKWSKFYERKS